MGKRGDGGGVEVRCYWGKGRWEKVEGRDPRGSWREGKIDCF